jgi:hypothetical protein
MRPLFPAVPVDRLMAEVNARPRWWMARQPLARPPDPGHLVADEAEAQQCRRKELRRLGLAARLDGRDDLRQQRGEPAGAAGGERLDIVGDVHERRVLATAEESVEVLHVIEQRFSTGTLVIEAGFDLSLID